MQETPDPRPLSLAPSHKHAAKGINRPGKHIHIQQGPATWTFHLTMQIDLCTLFSGRRRLSFLHKFQDTQFHRHRIYIFIYLYICVGWKYSNMTFVHWGQHHCTCCPSKKKALARCLTTQPQTLCGSAKRTISFVHSKKIKKNQINLDHKLRK